MSTSASAAFQPLRRAFAVNAVFSILAGLVMLAGANPLAAALLDLPQGVLGLSAPVLFAVVGAGTAAFGVLVAVEARREAPRLFGARLILALDAAWVIGSLVLLAAAPQAFTLWGRLIVADIAAVVALIALAEAAGLGALRRARALAAA
ncbi:hypothetical protein [Desertibaculum subflavum]|uniref:hypothetical protein n=1 Tax=Desertibaculum subflavum TaxID=2268458 RepID=UPI0013C44DE0